MKNASKIEKQVEKSKKSKKVTVFLGGSCDDGNQWRKDIKKEFGDDFFFIDPFDKNWEPEDNIYDETAGLAVADYVVFYKGGKGSKEEKDFLELIDKKQYKSFFDLDSLKKFLTSINKKKTMKKKKASFEILKDCAYKIGYPYIRDMDLFLENLESKDLEELLEDFESGHTIKIPFEAMPREKGTTSHPYVLSKKELSPMEQDKVTEAIRWAIKTRRGKKSPIYYDERTHEYKLVQAKTKGDYSYGCTMIDLPDTISQNVIHWGNLNIPDKALYTKDPSMGREDEIHVTLLYGLVDNDPSELEALLNRVNPFEIRLGLITAFKDNKDYEVLKIDVESSGLHKLHYLIEKLFPNKNSYPTYAPHVTIAFLKKGEADKFIGDEKFKGITFKANKIRFSDKDHKETIIDLNGQ